MCYLIYVNTIIHKKSAGASSTRLAIKALALPLTVKRATQNLRTDVCIVSPFDEERQHSLQPKLRNVDKTKSPKGMRITHPTDIYCCLVLDCKW